MITIPTILDASEKLTIQIKHVTKINAIEIKHSRRTVGIPKWDQLK